MGPQQASNGIICCSVTRLLQNKKAGHRNLKNFPFETEKAKLVRIKGSQAV